MRRQQSPCPTCGGGGVSIVDGKTTCWHCNGVGSIWREVDNDPPRDRSRGAQSRSSSHSAGRSGAGGFFKGIAGIFVMIMVVGGLLNMCDRPKTQRPSYSSTVPPPTETTPAPQAPPRNYQDTPQIGTREGTPTYETPAGVCMGNSGDARLSCMLVGGDLDYMVSGDTLYVYHGKPLPRTDIGHVEYYYGSNALIASMRPGDQFYLGPALAGALQRGLQNVDQIMILQVPTPQPGTGFMEARRQGAIARIELPLQKFNASVPSTYKTTMMNADQARMANAWQQTLIRRALPHPDASTADHLRASCVDAHLLANRMTHQMTEHRIETWCGCMSPNLFRSLTAQERELYVRNPIAFIDMALADPPTGQQRNWRLYSPIAQCQN